MQIFSEVDCNQRALRNVMFVTEVKERKIFGDLNDMGKVGNSTGGVFLVLLNEMVEDVCFYILIQQKITHSAMRRRA